MATYTSIEYIQSKKTIRDKIFACEDLIQAMEDHILQIVEIGAASIDEYNMDSGQMKVRTKYRTVKDLEQGIEAIEKRKQRLINSLTGRGFVMRDVRGLRG